MGGLAVTAVLSLFLVGQAPVVSVHEDKLPNLVATRQMMFFIPFAIDDVRNDQDESRQSEAESKTVRLAVQLWVSEDRGQNWRFVEAVASSRRRFLFRAKRDGEYWFAVRTVGDSAISSVEPPDAPEMRVLVDTQPPKLHLEAWRGDAGQVCSRWAIDETYLKPGSLEILYRTRPRQPWQPLAIDRRTGSGQTENADAPADYGPWMVNWYPSEGGRFVQIRAKVVDMAGNTAVSHAHVDMLESKLGKTDRPRQASGNLEYPSTTTGPIATRADVLSGWPTGIKR